ncbi:MAG: hypothetical protein IKH38_00535 [Clostridia bacterium]|nr:hypothetical protein [Clostridia bacterium]
MRMKRIVCLLLTALLVLGTAPELSALAAGPVPCKDGEHVWVKGDWLDPTCTENGFIHYRCRKCGAYGEKKTIHALGHDWGPAQTVTEATCTEDGKEVRICKRISLHKQYSTVPALGHDWGEWVTTKPATVEMPGLQARVCKRDSSHVETREIPQLVPEELSKEARLTIVSISGVPTVARVGAWVSFSAVVKNTSQVTIQFQGINARRENGETVFGGDFNLVSGGGTYLAPGETLTVPFKFRIVSKEAESCKVIGTASAYGKHHDGSVSSYYVPYQVQLIPKTDESDPGNITIVSVEPSTAKAVVGEKARVNIMVKNTGKEEWTYQGLRFYSASGDLAVSKATGLTTGTGTKVKPEETYSIPIYLSVGAEDIDPLQISGSVEAVADTPEGRINSPRVPVHITLTLKEEPEVTITKVTPGSGAGKKAGDWVSVGIGVKNTGGVPWTYSGITFADASVGSYNPTRQQSSDEPAGVLFAPGEERSFTLQIQLIPENLDDKALHGTLTVKADVEDALPIRSQAKVLNIPLDAEPRAELTLVSVTTGSGLGKKKGDTIPVTLEFQNTGDAPLEFFGVNFSWANGSNIWKLSGCSSNTFSDIEPGATFTETGSLWVEDPDLEAGALVGQIYGVAHNDSHDFNPYGFINSNKKDVNIELDGTPSGPKVPSLSLKVTTSTAEPLTLNAANQTQPVHYTAVVTNNSKFPVKTVRIELDDGYATVPTHAAPPKLLYPGESWTQPVTFVFDGEAKHADGRMHATFKGVCSYEDLEYYTNPHELSHAVQDTEPWTVTSVTLVKTETSTAKNDPHGYVVGEKVTFNVKVTNDSDVAIDSVKIHDELPGSSEDQTLHLLQPHENRDVTFTYTIQPEDIGGPVINTALARWTDPASGEVCTQKSNAVTIQTWEEPERPGSLHVTKTRVGEPNNGSYYVQDEVIHFVVTVENDSDSVMTDVLVTDPLSPNPGGTLALYPTLAPHEKKSEDVYYTVTIGDAGTGSVFNTATASGIDESGAPRTDSGDASATTGHRGEIPAGMSLQKEEINRPAKGYYEPNDIILYVITVTNTGECDLENVEVYDNLGWVYLGTLSVLKVNQSHSFTFSYTVKESDMGFDWIYNSATGYYDGGRHTHVPVISNEVRSPLKPGFPPVEGAGPNTSCVTELTALGLDGALYTLTPCPTHGAVLAEVRRLTAEAATEADTAAAWAQAESLWHEAVSEEYGEMLGTCGPQARIHLTAEQALFENYAQNLKQVLSLLWPEDTARVSRTMAQLWMRQCTELCYLYGNAPAARPDSVVGSVYGGLMPEGLSNRLEFTDGEDGTVLIRVGLDPVNGNLHVTGMTMLETALTRDDYAEAFRKSQRLWVTAMNQRLSGIYTAGGDDLRGALSAYRQSFNAVAAEHEALLGALYPDAPETVAEQMAMIWRNELLRLGEEPAAPASAPEDGSGKDGGKK